MFRFMLHYESDKKSPPKEKRPFIIKIVILISLFFAIIYVTDPMTKKFYFLMHNWELGIER